MTWPPRYGSRRRISSSDSISPPLSSFNLFKRATLEELRSNSLFSGRELMVECGRRWKALSESEKAVYVKMAQDDKLRFEQELQHHNQGKKACWSCHKAKRPCKGGRPCKRCQDSKSSVLCVDLEAGNRLGLGDVFKVMKEEAREKVAKVKSGYDWFRMEHEQNDSGSNPSGDVRSIQDKWQLLQPKQKKPYLDKASEDRIRFFNDIETLFDGQSLEFLVFKKDQILELRSQFPDLALSELLEDIIQAMWRNLSDQEKQMFGSENPLF